MSTGSEPLFGELRWNSSELGQALLLTPQRVNQLSKDHVLPQSADGLYTPIAAVSSYVRYLRQREVGKTQAGELVKKVTLENEMRLIRLRKIAGELVPLDRVKNDWFTAGRRVRDALLNLPPRLSGVFAAENDQNKIYESMNREIHDVLSELSSRQADTAGTESQLVPIAPEPRPAQPLEAVSSAPVDEVPERSPDEPEARRDAGALDQVSDNLPPTFDEAFLDRGNENPDDRFADGD